jgi:toxin ParE1/3/4
MKRSVVILPLARSDLREIGLYLAKRSLEVSKRFILAVNRTLEYLLGSPESGEKRNYSNPEYTSIRIWQVSGFSNYLIFYRVNETDLTIVRVLHGTRDYETIFNEDT